MVNTRFTTLVRHLRTLALPQAARELSDGQLLERFTADRDPTSFAAMMQRHGPLVLGVCRHVLHHAEDAEDAFQATFLVLARNASSIRKRDALAGWLHGVAYRIAMKAKRDAARRRRHEEQVRPPSPPQPTWEAAWREVQVLLDEEIERLPEKYRIPFILCCLESKSKAEAAAELGWKEGTVSSRLAEARKRLQRRLARRGLTLGSVLAAAAIAPNTEAAVPALLADVTARGALASVSPTGVSDRISATVAVLAEGAGKTVLPAKFKIAMAILLAVGTLIVGIGLAHPTATAAQSTSSQTDAPPARPKEPPAAHGDADRLKGVPALEEVGDKVTVRGRVLSPDGKPFEGAEISVWWHYGYWIAWHPQTVNPIKPRALGKSGPDGRFRFTFAKSEIDDTPMSGLEKPWRHSFITAAAKGYGPGWKGSYDLDKQELTLRLVKDDVPIEGRVRDLQGRPIAGATVRLDHLTAGEDHFWQTSWAGLSEKVTTDQNGRFVLTSIGRDRNVLLHVEGPGIEHKLVSVGTHAVVDGKKVDRALVEVIAGPTKPIVGTVRARDTGKPLAGVVVYGEEDTHRRAIRAVTDEQGRYRLVGLPKAGSYKLTAYPKVGQSYLVTPIMTPKEVADSEGLKPITADIELWRGVTVRFRLIDEETGQPVRRSVQYTPLPDNPFKAKIGDPFFPSREFYRSHSPDKDGYFQFVASPGPGILFCLAGYGSTPYLKARPDPTDVAKWFAPGKSAADLVGFINASEGYRLINPEENDDALAFDIRLSRGRTLTGRLVGPDGKPVIGATAYGQTFDASALQPPVPVTEEMLKTETFTMRGLCPKERAQGVFESRTLTFVHKERKLIGHAVVQGNEKGPLTIPMQPWGTLTGRLVDASGKPMGKVRVKSWHGMPRPGIWPPDAAGGEVETDRDGRFRLEYLVPGLKRDLILSGELSAGEKLKDLTVRPGEVKDLGDVLVLVRPVKKSK